MAESSFSPAPLLSVVIPVFNERDNLDALLGRLQPVLAGITSAYEMIYVDDGSTDDTAAAFWCGWGR